MKFIEIAHPEGGRYMVHVDHITTAHFRAAEGDVKTRLSIDIDVRQNDIVLFGDEAQRTWDMLQKVKDQV